MEHLLPVLVLPSYSILFRHRNNFTVQQMVQALEHLINATLVRSDFATQRDGR